MEIIVSVVPLGSSIESLWNVPSSRGIITSGSSFFIAALAMWSAPLFPSIPWCPGTWFHTTSKGTNAFNSSSNSVLLTTDFLSAVFHPFVFHVCIHFVQLSIKNLESVKIDNLSTPFSVVFSAAAVAACISAELLVCRPWVGLEMFQGWLEPNPRLPRVLPYDCGHTLHLYDINFGRLTALSRKPWIWEIWGCPFRSSLLWGSESRLQAREGTVILPIDRCARILTTFRWSILRW